jgi:hypothetical protein
VSEAQDRSASGGRKGVERRRFHFNCEDAFSFRFANSRRGFAEGRIGRPRRAFNDGNSCV